LTRALAAALLGALLGATALLFDTASLWVPAVALVALGLGSAVWVTLAAMGAGVAREAGPATVEEERPYPLRLEVRGGLFPPPGGELFEPVLDRAIPLGRHRRVRVQVRFERRGRKLLEPTRLVLADPLGLARREITGTDRGEVLVLPRVEPVLSAAGGGAPGGMSEGGGHGLPRELAAIAAGAAELELDSLRPYREGTPASRIHWPTVARSGQMMERRLVAEASSAPLVVLDPRSPASEADLDMAVRAAASLVWALAQAGGCALLLPGDRRPGQVLPDLRTWPLQHARLALVEASERPPALTRVQRTGAVFWVVARVPGSRRGVPAALDRAVAQSRWIVAPRPMPGAAVQLTVAGCSMQRLGRGSARAAA
jgi:uncharacterized protein (DUF58 family)